MSRKREAEFEVIDQYGERHRFRRDDGYFWEWRLKAGTLDVEGAEFLDVFKSFTEDAEGGEGFELAFTFPRPARVGNVSEDTCLTMPLRELQMEQCPRCGFIARPPMRG